MNVALSGDADRIARAILARMPISHLPDEFQLDYKDRKATKNWMARLLGAKQGFARWPVRGWSITIRRGVIVEVQVPNVPATAHDARTWLAGVPFEVASFVTMHPSWYGGTEPYEEVTTFADGHFPHGWACAFRGEGHARLVSRRWLDHGPWALSHEDGDLSFVLFHDPAADASTALAQARIGHARMGIGDEGGYLQSGPVLQHDLRGQYVPAAREMRIVASRRDVEMREMLDACAARRSAGWGTETPVDHVAYVFLEEDRARRHLHELWLRDLRCLAMIDGEETRLDTDHHPTPVPPAWAAALPRR